MGAVPAEQALGRGPGVNALLAGCPAAPLNSRKDAGLLNSIAPILRSRAWPLRLNCPALPGVRLRVATSGGTVSRFPITILTADPIPTMTGGILSGKRSDGRTSRRHNPR